MSTPPAPRRQDCGAGAEPVFCGQVDTATARADDVLLWDDDAVIDGVAAAVAAAEARAA